MVNALWQRICYRCQLVMTKQNPTQTVVCVRCGWIWN